MASKSKSGLAMRRAGDARSCAGGASSEAPPELSRSRGEIVWNFGSGDFSKIECGQKLELDVFRKIEIGSDELRYDRQNCWRSFGCKIRIGRIRYEQRKTTIG